MILQINNLCQCQTIRIKSNFQGRFYQIFDDSRSQIIIIKNKFTELKLSLTEPSFKVEINDVINSFDKIIEIEFGSAKNVFGKKRYRSKNQQNILYLENHPILGLEMIISFPLKI